MRVTVTGIFELPFNKEETFAIACGARSYLTTATDGVNKFTAGAPLKLNPAVALPGFLNAPVKLWAVISKDGKTQEK